MVQNIRNIIVYIIVAVVILLGYMYKGDTYVLNKDKEKTIEEKIKSLGWTKFSDMEVDPAREMESPWKQNSHFSQKKLADGILHLRTNKKETGHYVLLDDRLDNASGTTAEIRIRLLNTPSSAEYHDAAMFGFQDGIREGKISFLSNKILIYDQNELMNEFSVDTRRLHTYGITIRGDDLNVTVDGATVANSRLINEAKGKMFFFGDAQDWDRENMEAEISYICYRVGAKASVPK